MTDRERIDILIEGTGVLPEKVQSELAATNGVEAFLSPRRNAGGQAAWSLFVEFAPNALPFIIETLKLGLGRSRPTKIKVGDFEVENPTPELIEEAIRRSKAQVPPSQ